ADYLHAAPRRVAKALRRGEAAPEQDLRPLDDLVLHPVVEVVVHLLDELVVREGVEVDVLQVVGHRFGAPMGSRVPRCGTVPYDGTAKPNLAEEPAQCPASSP